MRGRHSTRRTSQRPEEQLPSYRSIAGKILPEIQASSRGIYFVAYA
jgi:hypothetical protein